MCVCVFVCVYAEVMQVAWNSDVWCEIEKRSVSELSVCVHAHGVACACVKGEGLCTCVGVCARANACENSLIGG